MKYNIIFILLSVTFSCGKSSSQKIMDEDTSKLSDTIYMKERSSINNELILMYKENMVNPDTNLAVFLYENFESNEYVGFYEQYQRWVIDYKTIKPLILKLFKKEGNIDSIMNVLELKKDKIIILTKEIVLDDYEKYNVISSPDFEFLCEIKSKTALELIEKIKNNLRAPDDEKEYAKEMKSMYFK